MVLVTGRKGTTTPRDERILQALFLCRYMTTSQIATLFFGSPGRARARLLDLERKKYLDHRVFYVQQPTLKAMGKKASVWNLTKAGFGVVAATFGDEESYATKQLGQKSASHYVRSAEVYAAAAPYLDEELGAYPEWRWLHEQRVADAGEFANQRYVHNPDAHIVFREHAFIVERQTAESNIGPDDAEDKVAAHARYARLVLFKEGLDGRPAYEGVEVLFACDNLQIAHAAERAGKIHGLPVRAGSVPKIADYLHNTAARLY